jgi:hypothetical protein
MRKIMGYRVLAINSFDFTKYRMLCNMGRSYSLTSKKAQLSYIKHKKKRKSFIL